MHVAARASCSVLVARGRHPFGGSVVVGVNGSPPSEQALDFAFDTAARRGSDLRVVRAPTPGSDTDDDRLLDLAELVAVREDKYGIPARSRMSLGDPAATLLAESQGGGLLIVGARGHHRYDGLSTHQCAAATNVHRTARSVPGKYSTDKAGGTPPAGTGPLALVSGSAPGSD